MDERRKIPLLEAGRSLLRKPIIIFLLILLTSWLAAAILQANSYDNTVHRHASWNVYVMHRWPYEDPEEWVVRAWRSPTHTAFLVAPFVLLGPDAAAFWNVVFILILLTGNRTGGAAIATLALVVSPPLVFVIAAANVPGITTALGLIFILADKRGPIRGLAWAFLAGRPQDNVLTLLWSGLESMRQRDWRAFAVAGMLMVPSAITLNHWIQAIPASPEFFRIETGTFYSLGMLLNAGLPATLLFVTVFLAYRLIVVRRAPASRSTKFTFALRRRSDISRTEFAWILNAIWLVLSPYYFVYQLWMVLLPVREYGAIRTIVLAAGSMVIGLLFMRELTMPGVYYGGMALLIFVALLTPKPCAGEQKAHTTSLVMSASLKL